jgi:hypothetical protein
MSPIRPLFLMLVLGLSVRAAPAEEAPAAAAPPAPAEPATPTGPEAPAKPAPLPYDEIVVKGVTLQGHIVSFGEKSLVFETIYGKGKLEIAYDDLEQLRSQESFRFIQRDGQSTRGRIAQFSARDMVVATSDGEVKMLKPENLERVIPDITQSRSFADRIRNRFPYSSTKLDLGWNLEAGSSNKVQIEGGINYERRKAPTRYVLDFRASYETTGKEGEEQSISEDEYRGSLLGEYDLKKSLYIFLFPAAERDAIRNVALRFYPASGVGYRLAETGKLRFQVQAGLAYVYEEFIDYPQNEYAALHVGFEGGYDFTSSYTVTWKAYYYPGLEDPSQNWLFRTEMAFSAKVTKSLSLNLRLTDTLDNTPAPDVGDNKFTTTLNFGVTF